MSQKSNDQGCNLKVDAQNDEEKQKLTHDCPDEPKPESFGKPLPTKCTKSPMSSEFKTTGAETWQEGSEVIPPTHSMEFLNAVADYKELHDVNSPTGQRSPQLLLTDQPPILLIEDLSEDAPSSILSSSHLKRSEHPVETDVCSAEQLKHEKEHTKHHDPSKIKEFKKVKTMETENDPAAFEAPVDLNKE